jgi:brefeldin A-inhibited guanine nucleotide-exchange protein
LRLYLGHFSLPGESQQIERIVTAFSEHYCRENPTFLCEDSVYLLTYSLFMLQTDAHNTNVEKKMDLSSFMNMTKHIKVKKTENLQEDYLRRLYQSVTSSPLGVHHTAKKRFDE